MHANLQVVVILAIGFSLASLFAFIAQRLRLPSILGYLLAGYVIGPYSPGFVADISMSEQLAEIGVILMLFGVGLHFKLEDLIGVKNIAIPGAVGQTIFAAIAGFAIVYGMGWPADSGLIIGLAIGVASTVVLVRVLTDNHMIGTPKGYIAIGWLIVEDIFTVIILILLPTVASIFSDKEVSFINLAGEFIYVLGKFFLLGLIMFAWGQRVISFLLANIARLRSQELFTLTVLAIVFAVAIGSAAIFGTSIALGAFIAGMLIGKTNVRHQAASNALPLKDIFAVIFFLSVGMLFNPGAIAANFPIFIGVLGVILLVKPLVAFAITLALGYSLNIALTIAVALAQIGEFSFILAEEATNLHLLPDDGFDILVGCALVSISLNPLLFQCIDFIEKQMVRLPFFKHVRRREPKTIKKKETNKVVVVGFGPLGKEVTSFLKGVGINPFIVEQNIDTVTSREAHDNIFFGDAAESNILKDIHIEEASHLLITLPDTVKTVKIIDIARSSNPEIQIICRSQYIADDSVIRALDVQHVCAERLAIQAYLSIVHESFQPKSSS